MGLKQKKIVLEHIAKYIFSTLGLVEIIDIPLILTVMLCSDSEVTCGWGWGQFHTFKPRPYHTRKPPSLSFTVLMPMPHAHLKAVFQCGGPRSFQKSPSEDSYSNTCMICSHVKVKACTLRSQLQFFTFTYAILSVHLHMQKRPDPFTHA